MIELIILLPILTIIIIMNNDINKNNEHCNDIYNKYDDNDCFDNITVIVVVGQAVTGSYAKYYSGLKLM